MKKKREIENVEATKGIEKIINNFNDKILSRKN